MFGFGVQELVIILVIILILFGGKKLPELSRSISHSLKELRRGLHEEPEAEAKKRPQGERPRV
jgi:sec-independent protein translocase protein TatA